MKEKIETVVTVSALILVVIIFCLEFAKPIDNYYIPMESKNKDGIHYICITKGNED